MNTYRLFVALLLTAFLCVANFPSVQANILVVPDSANESTQILSVPGLGNEPVLDNVVNVTTGGNHTCALTADGGVKCWGRNYVGQLGDGTLFDFQAAIDVPSLHTGVSAISAGFDYTCALTTAGGVKCWGDNLYGQLGNGTLTRSATPIDVTGLSSGVTAITTGYSHSCALTSGGGVMCWGYNFSGQLGDGTQNSRLTPVNVSSLNSGVIAIAAGNSHTCALTASGAVKCWGGNYNGQLGDGTQTDRFVPVDVIGLSDSGNGITAGIVHTCALTSSGAVKCWGGNDRGQVGDESKIDRLVPVDVINLNGGVRMISAGGRHSCAITSSGGAKCWGNNYFGQLGVGFGTSDSTIPLDVIDLNSGTNSIAAGGDHSCAVTATNTVKCWGNNLYGQVGNLVGPWEIPSDVVIATPGIYVAGNNKRIADGDLTPSLEDNTDFGNVSMDFAAGTNTFQIWNEGSGKLSIAKITLSGPNASDFYVSSQPRSLVLPGNQTSFNVTFTPNAKGIRSATLIIDSNDSDKGSYDFVLQGTGLAPEVEVRGNGLEIAAGDLSPSPDDYTDFGNGGVIRTFSINNIGDGLLLISCCSLDGVNPSEFVVLQHPDARVQPGASTAFQVVFVPMAAGVRSAVVGFYTNDRDENSYSFAIQGNTQLITAPTITTQPTHQTVCEDPMVFTVPVIFDSAASGAPVPIAQWQQSIDAGGSFSDIPGATLPRLEFVANRSYNAFHYRVIFSNSAGTATSDVATLTVNTWPTISLQPSDQTVIEGQSVTFNAAASGSPTPGIQWQVKINGSADWQAIANATSPSLTFVAALAQNNNQYRALFSNSCGSLASNGATLHVNALPPVDTTAPDTMIGSTPPAQSNSVNASFKFSGTDNVTPAGSLRFVCSLDNAAFVSCSSPQNYTNLTNGNHSFQVRAVDLAGNSDPSPATYLWTINTVPPAQGIRSTIQGVRTALVALLTPGSSTTELNESPLATDNQGSTNHPNKQIQSAINKLDQALASNLWLDENHLSMKGTKVFDHLSEAVKELLAIKKPPTGVTNAIKTLISVTRALAQTAFDEALSAHGKPNKISKAQQEMKKAQQKLDKQQFTEAIACYKNAWVFAQEAVGKGIRAADDENSEEESESTRSQIFLPLLTR